MYVHIYVPMYLCTYVPMYVCMYCHVCNLHPEMTHNTIVEQASTLINTIEHTATKAYSSHNIIHYQRANFQSSLKGASITS